MIRSIKNLLWPVIFIGVTLFLLPTIADALGGDSGKHGNVLAFLKNSSGVIQGIGILLAACSGAGFLFVSYKEKRSLATLEVAGNKDPIWDEDSLKYQTRYAFYRVQHAWETRDMSGLQGYATPEFISWFKDVLQKKPAEAMSNIDITETHVVCCQNYTDNDKDKFDGYIKGNLIEPADEDQTPTKDFTEIYHFVRSGNDWLLNKINSGNILNLLLLENKEQE
jgi:predicted lipid-binding transport protein (Tim44 family)